LEGIRAIERGKTGTAKFHAWWLPGWNRGDQSFCRKKSWFMEVIRKGVKFNEPV